MSYPQPNVDKYAVNGYEFFRLNTLLTSDGDIYESPQTGLGLAIGPDSDISKVNVGYFDDQVPNFLNQIAVSMDRPFMGQISARNDVAYAPSSRAGRVLFWADELYNSTFLPNSFDNPSRIDKTPPVLDVVQFFTPVGLQPYRNNKTYRLLNIPFTASKYYFMFPYYGRRMLDFTIVNQLSGGVAIHYSVTGVRFNLRSNTTLGSAEITVIPSTALANATAAHKQSLAVTDGFYDAMYFTITSDAAPAIPSGQVPIAITVSDRQV